MNCVILHAWENKGLSKTDTDETNQKIFSPSKREARRDRCIGVDIGIGIVRWKLPSTITFFNFRFLCGGCYITQKGQHTSGATNNPQFLSSLWRSANYQSRCRFFSDDNLTFIKYFSKT